MRDQAAPIKNQQSSIEKLLLNFASQQKMFIELVFPHRVAQRSTDTLLRGSIPESDELMQMSIQKSVIQSSLHPSSSNLQDSQFKSISAHHKDQVISAFYSDQKPVAAPQVDRVAAHQLSKTIIKDMKITFQTVEEIDRLKRDANMYKKTQRNTLGVAKSSQVGIGSKSSQKVNWIELFNIGNVMLMRG